jgi:hypothetical protein
MPGVAINPHRFEVVTHWRFAASREHVWSALATPSAWPAWWPSLRDVRVLQAGPADGIGCTRRFAWRTPLGYALTIDVQTTEIVPPERLRGRACGELQGEGIWLVQGDGGFTQVTYLWRVQMVRPWMRLLAPVLGPLFRWSHEAVMRAGERGLAAFLAGEEDRAVRRSGTPPIMEGRRQ